MNKISFLSNKAYQIKQNVNNKAEETKNNALQQDSFELSNPKKETKKNKNIFAKVAIGLAALCGAILLILKGKSKQAREITLEAFRKSGGTFQDGVAFIKKNKKFNGKIIHEAGQNKFVMQYEDGLLKRADKNPDKYGFGNLVKKYTYDNSGKLTEVTTSEYELPEFASELLDENPSYIRILTDIEDFYTQKTISRTEYGPKEIKTFKTFKETAEGIRRAKLTNEEIQAEAEAYFKKVFKEKGIDEKLMPNFEISNNPNINHGGSYNPNKHAIEINVNAYREGIFNLEDVIEHEATHCQNSILRARLPQEKVQEIIKEELLSRILKYDADEVIYKNEWLIGAKTVKAPKMSEKMKKEFAQFAKDNLYTTDSEVLNGIAKVDDWNAISPDSVQSEYISKIKKLIQENPDFVAQYGNEAEAVDALGKYGASHVFRYNIINANGGNIDISSLPKLTPKEEQEAITSLRGYIETLEGNCRTSGVFALFGDSNAFNNYQFSAEEVQAQINGNTRLIKELTEKIKQGKAKGTLSVQQEANYLDAIKKAQLTMQYKKQGFEWYQKFLQLEAQPDDLKLKKEVEEGLKALKKIEEEISEKLINNGSWERVKPKI